MLSVIQNKYYTDDRFLRNYKKQQVWIQIKISKSMLKNDASKVIDKSYENKNDILQINQSTTNDLASSIQI